MSRSQEPVPQYTIRAIPPALDRALREQARRSGKSLNQVVIDALRLGLGLGGSQAAYDDLDPLIGSWVEGPAVEDITPARDAEDPTVWL